MFIQQHSPVSGVQLPVTTPADAQVAAAMARQFGADSGLEPLQSAELSVVAAELASNLVRHGRGGVLWMRRTPGAVELESLDRGPGIADVGAFLAGRSGLRAAAEVGLPRSVGEGGAAIRRLSDEVQVTPRDGGGCRVIVRKHLSGGGSGR